MAAAVSSRPRRFHVSVLLALCLLWNLVLTSLHVLKATTPTVEPQPPAASEISPRRHDNNNNNTRNNDDDMLWNDTFHVLLGVKGSELLRELDVALKSVLLQAPTQAKLEIHVIVDDEAALGLQTLLDQHQLEGSLWSTPISIQIYNLPEESLVDMKNWIGHHVSFVPAHRTTAKHTIGAFFRLFVPWILPNHVTEVLYMDTDVVIVANLNGLWTALKQQQSNSTHPLLLHWDGKCSGFVYLKAQTNLWKYVQNVDLAWISKRYQQKPDDQLILKALQHAHPELVARLPDAWTVNLANHYHLVPTLPQQRPQLGMVHYNGMGNSKKAYFEASPFVQQHPSTVGLPALYYSQLEWTWARYMGVSLIPPGRQGYPLTIHSRRVRIQLPLKNDNKNDATRNATTT